jgi:hypothetical protein
VGEFPIEVFELPIERTGKTIKRKRRKMKEANPVNIKEMNFVQLFEQISPEEISDKVRFAIVAISFCPTLGGPKGARERRAA